MWQAPNKISGAGSRRAARASSSRGLMSRWTRSTTRSPRSRPAEARSLMAKSPITDTSWWAIFEDPDGNHIGLYEGITDTAGQ